MLKCLSKLLLYSAIFIGARIDFAYAQVVPTILSVSPLGVQAFTMSSLVITVTTNENMVCKYSNASTTAPGPPGSGPSFAAMPNTFTSTGGTVSTQYISAIAAIGNYQYYYIVCQDQAGNFAYDSLGFTVSPPPAPSIPTLSVSTSGIRNVLSWTASTGETGVPVLYAVYRVAYLSGYGNVGSFQEMYSGISSTSWTDTTAVAGRTYKYEVMAFAPWGTPPPSTNPSNASNIVTVITPVPSIPHITTQPTNVTITSPETATFTVEANGTPVPSYQWMQELPGSNIYTTITGATNPSYTTAATTVSNNGTQYECVISNVVGSVTSNPATLTVNVVPVITTQPTNMTVTAPSTATFTVMATGTPAPSYQWMQSINGGPYTNITAATSASYTTPATTIANNGTQYECVVSNATGSVTSNTVTLTVNAVPVITTQPTSLTVNAPATATFTIAATGLPAPIYQWIQKAPGATSYTAISGAISTSYTTPATTTNNSGTQYECLVSNIAGNVISNPATLTVNSAPPTAPIITTQPSNVTVVAPAAGTFTIAATGSPAPTYQWQQGMASRFGIIFSNISGATSASYTTAATITSNNGTQYHCIVTNASGSVTSNPATLTVLAPTAPTITTQPSNQTVTAPQAATFTVVATGEPAPSYQWMQSVNGGAYANISGATSASYTTGATTASNNGTLFECLVSNASGSVTTNPASLTVNVSLTPVVSITSPANNSSFTAGANVTITASAFETNGTISSVSFYNGATLLGTTTTSPYSYTVTNIAAGTYSLTAIATDANNVSTTSSTVSISVNATPIVSITSPSNSNTFNAGSSITINASATEANGTINSVAFYNGETLLGTSYISPFSFTMSNLSVGNYSFSATAMDARGITMTSLPVEVTVVGQPVVNIVSPTNQSTLTTGSMNITAIASENYGSISSVAFYNGSTLLGTVTGTSQVSSSTGQAFTYSWTNVPAGPYNLTAVATDVIGTTATSSSITGKINALTFTYAIDDNILTQTDARNNTTSYQYDNLNRLLKTTFADNSTISTAYDLFGNQISITDQRNNTLTKTYDAYERLSQTKDPNNGITQYTYDAEGVVSIAARS